MAKTVFLTGGTGFVGSRVRDALVEAGYTVKLLARTPEDVSDAGDSVEVVPGDILEPETFQDAVTGCDAVVHLVGIIREEPSKGITFERLHTEATVNAVDAAKRAGVQRFIHMSANGVREDAVSDYHRTKWKGEEYVRASGLDWTIFRPSVIYGPGDSFINMLAGFIRYTPVFSYFGDGSYPMQPVSVYEVAEIFARSIDSDDTVKRTFSVCGRKLLTYKELLAMVSRVLDSTTLLLPVPEVFIRTGIAMFGKTSWFPITRDQFIMLIEGNTCSSREIFGILHVESRDMEETIASYLG